MDYRKILESRYDRKDWQELLYDIFRQKVQFWQQPQQVPVDKATAKQALYMGKITLSDGHILAVYEVELSDNISIKRNRAGIRNLLCSNWKGMGCVGAFMFCFRKNEAVLRFSYVSEAFAFAEDGSLNKESTDTKRFTYLLGKGHRSRTAIKQFEELKKSTLDLKAITKAFSVEALSDAFFNEYKKQYEDIVEFITGKRMVKVSNKWEEKVTGKPCPEIMQEFCQFPDAEKAVRDYVKKLMGRLVFIQFLQKKGWMGCPAGEAWNGGDKEFVQNLFAKATNKDTFVDDVLEPLFNDINTKRAGDLTSCPNVGTNIKIPYLNGGLFEKDNHDNISFPLPKKFMQNMLDFFASYNFTIDENDPDDAEIGVDPEMLGRIFENMLEDNKDKGAFYTPKEIVQYMCRESLIAYLQTDITDETIKESIRQFVTTHDATTLSNNLKAVTDQKLKDVKICDPAIGSGAFPMGLLHELYACRKPLEGLDDDASANIKTHIIQNNIYGVDIENGAVEIARLRFWLALIVDEKTPHALPNLDFKIMQGNSLLEQYKGVDLSKIMENNHSINGNVQMTLFENDINVLRHQLIALRKEYFNTYNKKQKESLRITMRGIVQQQIDNTVNKFTGKTGKEKNERIKMGNIDIAATSEFFLWHTWFSDVFENGGFDIVIGNPPYIDSETMVRIMPTLRELYTKQFSSASGNWDMFVVFIELGIKLLKVNGIFCNIIPNKLIAAKYGIELRNYISVKNIIEIRDYSRIDVFTNAAVYPVTILMRNGLSDENSRFTIMNDIVTQKQTNVTSHATLASNNYWDMFFVDSNVYNIIVKINKHSRLSNLFVNVLGAATVADAYEIKKMIKEQEADTHGLKFVNSGTIDPFTSLWGIKDCRYIKGKYSKPVISQTDLKNYSETRYLQSISPKIIVASMTTRYEAFLDIDGDFVAGKSTTIIIGSLDYLCFLAAIINSKLASYWLNVVFNSLKMSGGAINVGKNELQMLPIPEKTDIFKELINNIVAIKKENSKADTSSLEHEIDLLVYDLYGLTKEERLIVDPNYKE